jgi:hypothetical protein
MIETATPKAMEVLDALRETRYLGARTRLDAFGGLVQYDFRLPIQSIELLLDAETA